jgi:hypothetical protein
VQNAINPTAIGKKNWLFIREADAGDRSAIIYPIIESCPLCPIDSYVYFRDKFTRLPCAKTSRFKDCTPDLGQVAKLNGDAQRKSARTNLPSSHRQEAPRSLSFAYGFFNTAPPCCPDHRDG